MAQLQDQILSYLPAGIKAFIDGSSRRDLLRKVNATLLVFDNQLAYIEAGTSVQFQDEAGAPDPAQLALASKRLLGEHADKLSILLLLPPSLFVATSQSMPGVNKENLASALMLQADSLLPANPSPVTLAINSKIADLAPTPVALWVSNGTMVNLFAAFEEQELFIAAIKPRVLSVLPQDAALSDVDASDLCLVKLEQETLLTWLQTSRLDLDQQVFADQWQQAITIDVGNELVELNSIDDYLELVDRNCNQEYSFFPQGALSVRKQFEKGRKLVVAAGVVAVMLVLSSIPFVVQSLQFRTMAARLEAQRDLSYEARQDQSAVVIFENELGPVYDFPEQNLRDAMFTLQNVLSPNQLTSLEISEGLIKIQGTSSEPQAILQRLEQDPMFTEVAFSRATNNDRYYIDLRLSAVNFEAYMVRYFPDN